jgi:hypothetical protein
MFLFRWQSAEPHLYYTVSGPENSCTLQSRITKGTAAGDPSIIKMIEEKMGGNWQERNTPQKMMTRL